MKIQILSDLHLETLTTEKNWCVEYSISCNILCLIGDIGDPFESSYWSFIEYARAQTEYVLLVSGNHEYHSKLKHKVDRKIKDECKKLDNVFYLQQEGFVYENCVFLGCTLWSDIPRKYHSEFQEVFSDFKSIKKCTPDVYNVWHSTDKEWLELSINKAKNLGLHTIVLTHFTPLHNIAHFQKYKNNPSQYMFSSDMRYLFPKVDMWCFGHTHSNIKGNLFKISGCDTYFASNQQGNPQRYVYNFNPTFSIDTDNLYRTMFTTFDSTLTDFKPEY